VDELRNELTAYPNPTSGLLYINKKVNVTVYSMLGEVIMNSSDVSVVDISTLTPGLYNITIEYKNIKINKRIIKQ
jgi:hypothetical protein